MCDVTSRMWNNSLTKAGRSLCYIACGYAISCDMQYIYIDVEDEDRDPVGGNAVRYLFPAQKDNFQLIFQLVSSILCILWGLFKEDHGGSSTMNSAAFTWDKSDASCWWVAATTRCLEVHLPRRKNWSFTILVCRPTFVQVFSFSFSFLFQFL